MHLSMLTRVPGADTVHPRTGLTLAVPAVFRLAEMARSTLRGSMPRVLAGMLRHSRLCAAASHAHRARRGSCAGAVLLSRRSATRGWGHVAWSGPFSASRSLLGFPSRELGRQRGRSVVTRVTVSLSTPFARRRSWGFQMSLRRFGPADGRASRFHALGPTCRSSIDRSRCFSRAIGRPG
jgi:hypothetical protein